MSGGRPTKYRVAFIRQALRLAQLGATQREIAEFFEVDESTLRVWLGEHSRLAAALKQGKDYADDRVEQSLYRRALGYSHDAVKILQNDGAPVLVPYVEHFPPDTTACIFWLKNRRPEDWRERVIVDANVRREAEGLTDEELIRIARGGSPGAA